MKDPKKAITLLQKQIDKLDKEAFDLDAWKASTQSLLESLFGAGNSKVKQVYSLKIDYSSWALRDSTAKYNPVDSCKQMGREILETTIGEIDAFGLPTTSLSANQAEIIEALRAKLTKTDLKKLYKAFHESSAMDRFSKVSAVVSKLKPEVQAYIASVLLASDQISKLYD